jgi:hypothetical protein
MDENKNEIEDSIEDFFKQYKQNWNKKLNVIDKTILNRRKKKLDEILYGNNDFFSEENIKQRDPILYEIYVGSHKKRHQIFNIDVHTNSSMSKFLMNEIESDIHNQNIKNELLKEYKIYGENSVNKLYVSKFYYLFL